ncbi:MAG: amidase, partial [Planctomycetaceae bacterium]
MTDSADHHQAQSEDAGDSPLPWRPTRRKLLQSISGIGLGSLTLERALAAQAETAVEVTPTMVQQAEWIAGLELNEQQREQAATALNRALAQHRSLRGVDIPHSVPPAVAFNPAPTTDPTPHFDTEPISLSEAAAPVKPADASQLAFLPVSELSSLLRTRQVSSVELTRLYLERLRAWQPTLNFMVTETEELALQQAQRADREFATGRYRGPLHGIPWGAKDLMAVPGYKTTWGAPPFRDQQLDDKATVAQKLEDAGAVLVAKLSLGALASGDRWFGGQTRNPWDPEQGSSGSSAGSASATAAGCVGFAIGSETHGSIVSPCRRCGTTGLRPTFGRVSRAGCMTLSWSMDKLGPIARSVEDCAVIFGAIHGRDEFDPTTVDRPFAWPARRALKSLRVGYVSNDQDDTNRHDLQVLRDLGAQLVPIKLPDTYPVRALLMILYAEAATVFDELIRSGNTEGLNSWPRALRNAQFTPAVEYLRANRIRTMLMREMQTVFENVDLYVGGDDLTLTNLTGHPTVVLPDKSTERKGRRVPFSLTFTGRLYGETDLLAVAHAYQQVTGVHLEHP